MKALLAHQPDELTVRTWVEGLIGSNLTVTNLGALNIPQQFGQLKLRQLRVTVTGLRQEPLIVGVVTIGGQMCVTLRYWESVSSKLKPCLLQQKAREKLQKAIELNIKDCS